MPDRAKRGKRSRRAHPPHFKAEVAIAAVQAGRTTQQLSDDFGVHRNLVRKWRDELIERAEEVFFDHDRTMYMERREDEPD
ncbi:MAG: hypothetical protein OSA97_10940 [Nevskia sp.]|nr:hypothetical protein [Nevskia sp.]